MDWLLDLGYFGLFVGSFLAGSVLPLSSDVLLVGMLAAGARPVWCLVAASVGNWLGAMTSYRLGRYARWDRLERWFGVKPETLARHKERVDRFGVWLAPFFWLPGMGVVFMVALGLYRVRPRATALLALAGSFVRFLFWILLHAVWRAC